MSLATRCTACGTIFKVVQDQLKVSEGWVRCGRCHEVFNALEGLFDLERDPPPQRPPLDPQRTSAPGLASAPTPAPADTSVDSTPAPTAPAAPRAHTGLASVNEPPPAESGGWTPTEPAALGEVPSTHEDDALESRWLIRPARDGLTATQRASHKERSHDFSDAEFPIDVDLGDDLDESFFGSHAEPPPAEDALAAAPEALESARVAREAPGERPTRSGASSRRRSRSSTRKPEAATPAFIRQAERQARWHSPAARLLLSLLGLVLTGSLLAQIGLRYRNEINAAYPPAHDLLDTLCTLAGCRLGSVQRIDDLTVDSATLTQTDVARNEYRLSVGLRNHGRFRLAMPDLDLVLTDTNGAVIARRAISPAQLGLRATLLDAASTQNVDLRFTAVRPVSGYTVEIFYP